MATLRALLTDRFRQACNRMIDLRNQCIHPTSKKPYITTSSGGRQNSSEGTKVCSILQPLSYAAFAMRHGVELSLMRLQADYSHAFVVEFASEEDRDFYDKQDQAHLEFKKSLKDVVEKVGIVDYTPGVY